MKNIYLSIIFIICVFINSSYADTLIPLVKELPASLGSGYDSKNQDIAGQCIEGKVVYTGLNTSEESFLYNASYKQIVDSISGGVSGSLNLSYFNINGQFNYASNTASSDLNLTYTDIISISPKRVTLTDYKIADGMQSLIVNPDGTVKNNVESYCGDEFITQAILGAKLFVNVKFLFKNSLDKKEFAGKLGANIYSIASIQGKLNVTDKKLLSNTVISIETTQIGGDVAKLALAIPSESVYCSLNNQDITMNGKVVNPIQSCLQILDSLSAYKANFASQLKNKSYDLYDSKGWAYFGWVTTKYKNTLVTYNNKPIQITPKIPSPPLDQAIYDSRIQLKNTYDNQLKYSRRASELLFFNIPLVQKKKLFSISQLISSNLDLLTDAVRGCFGDDTSYCVQSTTSALNNLKAFDENTFLQFEYENSNDLISGMWISNEGNFKSFLNFAQYGTEVLSVANYLNDQNHTIISKGGFIDKQTLYLSGNGEKDLFKDNNKAKCSLNTSIRVKMIGDKLISVQFKPQPALFQYDSNCPINSNDICIFEKGDEVPVIDQPVLNPPMCKEIYYSKY